MYKSINGIIKCEKDAEKDFKQFDPFSELYSKASFSVVSNADIKSVAISGFVPNHTLAKKSVQIIIIFLTMRKNIISG